MGRPLEQPDCAELEHYIIAQNAICSRKLLDALIANHGDPCNDNPKPAPKPYKSVEPEWWPSMWFGDLVSDRAFNTNGLTVAAIVDAVSLHFNVSKTDILSHRRTRHIVRPRQVCYYLAKKLTFKSLPEIGRRLGGRDHTSALSGIRKIEELRSNDRKLDADLRFLAKNLGGSLA